MRVACSLLICSGLLSAAQTAEEIMARVAANQDQAQELRSQYRFHQNVLVRVQRANGKLAREEIRDYRVVPTGKASKRELLHLEGKVLDGNRVIPFTATDYRYKGVDIDGEIVTGIIDNLSQPEKKPSAESDVHMHVESDDDNDKTRDGISKELFPLSTWRQKHYTFKLDGEEEYRGHQVYRISFVPKKGKGEDQDWAGEALIDKAALQPVMINTHPAFGIPIAVKVILGTNLQHVGFKVTYEKFPGDVWFPVSYGGELRFRVLFMYARRVSLGLINSEFERADVQSNVAFEMPDAK